MCCHGGHDSEGADAVLVRDDAAAREPDCFLVTEEDAVPFASEGEGAAPDPLEASEGFLDAKSFGAAQGREHFGGDGRRAHGHGLSAKTNPVRGSTEKQIDVE